MTVLLLTLGAPGCGKSTQARLWQQTGPRARVNRDELRAMLHGADSVRRGADGDQTAEDRVTIAQRATVSSLLIAGVDVVIDDTNIRPGVLTGWVDLAEQLGAEARVWDLRHVPVDTCLARIDQRAAAGGRTVPESVVRRLHAEALQLAIPPGVTAHRAV